MEETANMSVEQMKALISELGLSVAIDGPSGSGKSTVARALARELGIGYLDTGAMYRALTWYCLDAGLPLDDHAAVAGAADSFPLSITTSPDDFRVTVGDTDVTEQIRESCISKEVSKAAQIWTCVNRMCANRAKLSMRPASVATAWLPKAGISLPW